MTEQEINIEQEHYSIDLGHLLRSARSDANVSVDTLARKLNLTVAQINELENCHFENLGADIFIKGYIKSYCKIFGLDESLVMRSYQRVEHDPQESEMQSFSKRFEKETHDSRLMLVSYIVLFIILGSTLLWWWQSSNAGDSTHSETEKEEVAQQTLPAVVESQEIKTTAVTNAYTKEISTPELSQQSIKTEITTEEKLKPEVINKNHIVMKFSGDSWVEIFDATGNRVAFGVKKTGYTMNVKGIAPFSVVLGKHHLVEISLDGDAVDISSLPKNQLAKFNLPFTKTP